MANTLKSAVVNGVGLSTVIVQTVPTSKTHIVLGISIKNKLSSYIGGRVFVEKSTGETFDIVGVIPPILPSEIVQWEGKIFLQAGDMIKVVSDTAASLDVMTNYVEGDA